ncbi:RNA polymerase III RPC4 [Botrytis cinerea]
MPPKAERGATSRGRPRGRGRGRGRGIAIEEIETPELRGALDEPSQPSQSPAPIAPVAPMASMTQPTATIIPKTEPNDDAFDPNASPAMPPAETSAGNPSQTPAINSTRLPSRTESVIARGRGGASTRARGESTTGRARFKPKNIRRDQADRDRLEQEERDRIAANQAQAEKEARRSQRGRGHTGRGRGDAMGQNRGAGRGAPISSATGIFSVAPAAMDRKGGMDGFAIANTRGGGGGGGGGGFGGGGGGGSGGGGGGGGYGGSGSGNGGGVNVLSAENMATFNPEYPDDDGQARKVNIEMINLVDDDDEMVGSGRGGNGGFKSRSLAPIRIKREEHKERSNMMVSDPELAEIVKKQADEVEDTQSGEDVEMTVDGATTTDEPRAKGEPGLESPTMSTFPEFKAPSSPEDKKHPKREPISPQQSKVRPSRKKDKMPVIQTEEDKFEYERYLEDVDILAEELRLLRGTVDKTAKDKGKGKAVDVDGDVGMDGEQEQDEAQPEANHADGRIYLFQFPPVLPRLFNPQVENSDDVVVTQSSEQIDLTDDKEKGIKKESEEVIIKTEPNLAQENEALVSEQGYIGKLVVRKSGKVELDWGGTSMAVGRGVPAAFLSQIVLAEDPKGEAPEGVATGLGKVMGKFIVTPDWEKIF